MSLLKLQRALARLRTPDPKTPRGLRTVRVEDLDYVLAEYERASGVVADTFAATGEWTKLIANDAIPIGYVCMADQDGKITFFGPMPEMPQPGPGDVPGRIVMNLHPITLAAIEATTQRTKQ